jgi:ATP-binding cassette, subfamily C, bacterial CydD
LFLLLLTPEAFLPVRNAAAAFHASADGTAAAARVFEILDSEPDTPAPSTASPAPPAARTAPPAARPLPDLRREPIRLDRVTLGYPDRPTPVIERASLTIWPGDRITLVGSNGAGKTTLLEAFLLFIEPQSGTMLVGDTEVGAVPANRWRGQIGWLPQQPSMFAWSVAENITLGRPGSERAAVERAAGTDCRIDRLGRPLARRRRGWCGHHQPGTAGGGDADCDGRVRGGGGSAGRRRSP